MAYEQRRGRPYYYRTRRTGEKVRKTYVGRGAAADAAARADAEARAARQTLQAQEAQRAATEAALAVYLERSARVLFAALACEGIHQHHRGAWRRRRGRQE